MESLLRPRNEHLGEELTESEWHQTLHGCICIYTHICGLHSGAARSHGLRVDGSARLAPRFQMESLSTSTSRRTLSDGALMVTDRI